MTYQVEGSLGRKAATEVGAEEAVTEVVVRRDNNQRKPKVRESLIEDVSETGTTVNFIEK